MKINSLKINGFGKLESKDINLIDGINIVYGENESGKSTLLKFITSMFYGLTKNKNGGSVPELEKFKPWKAEEFSGKISYSLDNGESYEVYRDFNKKNPKIFNKNLEDISNNFNIDKTKGNQFFYEQIGIEEDIFESSIVTKQAEVKLDEKEQNNLIQKISNILGTGEDNISYSSVVSKLKKKLNDEIGTSNTKERPINIIENRITSLNLEKNELEGYQSEKFEINEEITNLEENIRKNQNELDKLRLVNISIEKLKDYKNKIDVNKNILKDTQGDLDKATLNKKDYKIGKNKVFSKLDIFIILATLLFIILSFILIKNVITQIASITIFIIYIFYLLFKLNKNKIKEKNLNSKQNEITERIKILEENKEKQKTELEKLEKEYNEKLSEIRKEYEILELDNVLEKIDEKQNLINTESIELHKIKVDYDNITSRLERLVNIEEELDNLEEEKEELEKKRDNIKRTLDYLEIAYNKMKEQVTPKFTEELSNLVGKISDGKYESVNVNTEGRIIVETKMGEYIDAENLSIGTIDQLYLSLRIAAIKEITKENMPIVLDEAFAYYDENRLENMLKYLSSEYSKKQIIILTCTKREKEILDRLDIKYNLIEL